MLQDPVPTHALLSLDLGPARGVRREHRNVRILLVLFLVPLEGPYLVGQQQPALPLLLVTQPVPLSDVHALGQHPIPNAEDDLVPDLLLHHHEVRAGRYLRGEEAFLAPPFHVLLQPRCLLCVQQLVEFVGLLHEGRVLQSLIPHDGGGKLVCVVDERVSLLLQVGLEAQLYVARLHLGLQPPPQLGLLQDDGMPGLVLRLQHPHTDLIGHLVRDDVVTLGDVAPGHRLFALQVLQRLPVDAQEQAELVPQHLIGLDPPLQALLPAPLNSPHLLLGLMGPHKPLGQDRHARCPPAFGLRLGLVEAEPEDLPLLPLQPADALPRRRLPLLEDRGYGHTVQAADGPPSLLLLLADQPPLRQRRLQELPAGIVGPGLAAGCADTRVAHPLLLLQHMPCPGLISDDGGNHFLWGEVPKQGRAHCSHPLEVLSPDGQPGGELAANGALRGVERGQGCSQNGQVPDEVSWERPRGGHGEGQGEGWGQGGGRRGCLAVRWGVLRGGWGGLLDPPLGPRRGGGGGSRRAAWGGKGPHVGVRGREGRQLGRLQAGGSGGVLGQQSTSVLRGAWKEPWLCAGQHRPQDQRGPLAALMGVQ
mmetsp:Transcript_139554/g.242800  ORF Transcript_139554/g.242800 Transcript_139554/m.242800 type:complete len:590 (-) Transcript_139554:1247-3016(-)